MAAKPKNTKMLTVNLPQEMFESFKRNCQVDDIKMSDAIKSLINSYLNGDIEVLDEGVVGNDSTSNKLEEMIDRKFGNYLDEKLDKKIDNVVASKIDVYLECYLEKHLQQYNYNLDEHTDQNLDTTTKSISTASSEESIDKNLDTTSESTPTAPSEQNLEQNLDKDTDKEVNDATTTPEQDIDDGTDENLDDTPKTTPTAPLKQNLDNHTDENLDEETNLDNDTEQNLDEQKPTKIEGLQRMADYLQIKSDELKKNIKQKEKYDLIYFNDERWRILSNKSPYRFEKVT